MQGCMHHMRVLQGMPVRSNCRACSQRCMACSSRAACLCLAMDAHARVLPKDGRK